MVIYITDCGADRRKFTTEDRKKGVKVTKSRFYHLLSILSIVVMLAGFFTGGPVMRLFYAGPIPPIATVAYVAFLLIFFLVLSLILWAKGDETKRVKERFSDYFYRPVPEKGKWVMQAYVDGILRNRACEFLEACKKQDEFNKYVKTLGIMTGYQFDEISKQMDAVDEAVRNKKAAFWVALHSAEANGFKVVHKVDHYRDLDPAQLSASA